ncbi:MAG: proton-conducting membrane transporter [Planctomycetes bacterium]|nr:proton-conducting membrane transporter [Planctomycetota bacterium]
MSGLELALAVALLLAVTAPGLASIAAGLWFSTRGVRPGERFVVRATAVGLFLSFLASAATALLASGWIGSGYVGELDLGSWLRVGGYEVPAVFLFDRVALAFSLLAAAITALVAQFSRRYLHREPGFLRFFVLLGMFASGTQLVAFAGALDVMFAGWELMGISSALFIGFFLERPEPLRSSVRAFATYRLCDAGFLLAIVSTHELLGSTRLAALEAAPLLAPSAATAIASLFLLSALGKSAQLPFSGWLARAIEGPTPSSALFYGSVSIHTGLFLLLRVWPLLEVAPLVRWVGIALGLATALYATAIARVHADAKGVLAHATLAQVGLILAEICAGWIELALLHLVGHALLRVWQYLRAPNAIHDAHRTGRERARAPWLTRLSPRLALRLYGATIHRFRLDERVDACLAPLLALVRKLDGWEQRYRRRLSLDREEEPR